MSTKFFWRGQPIEELSREELEQAVVQLGNRLAAFETPDNIRAFAIGMVEMLKARGYGPLA